MAKVVSNISFTDNGCWEWTATKVNTGYGFITFSRKGWLVHRLTYLWVKGEIPDGFTIDHTCRNRACCNPDHLEAVTLQVNILRAKRGQLDVDLNACRNGHALADPNSYYARRDGRRQCKKCSAGYRKRRSGLAT
jgi:hypothetical protein